MHVHTYSAVPTSQSRRAAAFVGAAVALAVVILALASATPALAGITNASTFSKTGTDTKTSSTADSSGTVGTTAAGNTINWVLSYANTTGSLASTNITDPIGANQTFVKGSLKTPPGLSPAWSTNGGGSYTTPEPASGVNAIRAAGNGLSGEQSIFSAPLSSFNAGASQGDGWEALFIGGNIYNIHHHTPDSATGDSIIDCHVAATGAECPGYPAIGQTYNTTAGTPLGGAPSGPQIITSLNNNATVNGAKIYFPAGIAGTNQIGVACIDTSNNTSCGFTQLGTSTFANCTLAPPGCVGNFDEIAGGGSIGGKYYTVGAAPGAPVYCFDTSTNASCAGWTNPQSVPGYTPASNDSGYHSNLDTWGGYIFTDMSTQDLPTISHSLGCIVAATGAQCPGAWPQVNFSTGAGIDNHSLAPITNASGTLSGICASDQLNTSAATYKCFSLTGAPLGGAPWGQMVVGDMVGLQMIGDPLLLGNRLYLPYVNAGGASTYTCWDFLTNSACQGFTPVASGNTATQAYTLRQDPNAPDCIWELGNGGTFEVFSATFGGHIGCSTGSTNIKLTPADYYCDGKSGHVTGWNQLQLYGVNSTQYDAVAVTITDANGNPVPGWTNKVIPSSQVPIDISSIPYAGSTTTLNVKVVIDWGTHPVVAGAAVAATFKGDPEQVCFQTKVGPAACDVSQSITNQGNAVTDGSNNVSDSPTGNNTGYASFTLPPDPTTAGCVADVSIVKSVDAKAVAPGGQLAYTLLVQNKGPNTATSVKVSDSVPAGLTVVSVQPSQGKCTTAGTIDCSLGTMLNGGTAQILVTTNVSPLTSGAGSAASSATGSGTTCSIPGSPTSPAGTIGTLTNTTNVSAFQPDSNPANNRSAQCVPVVPPVPVPQPVDVSIVKHVNHSVAKFGEVLTYTLDVTNSGPGTAPNQKVTDTSLIAMKVISIKSSQGTCLSKVPYTCTLGAVAAHQHVKITIRAIPKQTGTEINTVLTTPGCTSSGACPHNVPVEGCGAGGCPAPDNVSHARTVVKPYLTLIKKVDHHIVRAGTTATYHLVVRNPTPAALKNVRVCDQLPLGLAYVSSNPRATLSNGQQCWRYKRLKGHRSKTITLIARALPGASGRLVNHATATAKGVSGAHAHQSVTVIPAPAPPTPVTG